MRRLFSGVLTARIVSAVLQAGALAILARLVGPEQFGQVAVMVAVTSVALALSDLGLATLAARTIARDRFSPEIGSMLQMARRLCWCTCFLIIVGVCLLSIVSPFYWIFLPLALWAVTERRLSINLGVGIATGHASVNAIGISVGRLSGFAVFLVGIIWADLGAVAYTVSLLIGSAIGLMVTSFMLRQRNSVWLPSAETKLREMLRSSLPFWWASLSYQIRMLDVVFVGAVSGATVSGIYAVPSRLSSPLRLLPNALNQLAIPFAARGDEKSLRELKKMMLWIIGASFCVLSVIAVYAEQIIVYIIGADYHDSVLPLRILFVGIMINILASFKSGILQGMGHEVYIARIGITIAVFSCFSVTVGAATGDAVGAAIGMTATYLLQFVLVSIRRT